MQIRKQLTAIFYLRWKVSRAWKKWREDKKHNSWSRKQTCLVINGQNSSEENEEKKGYL